ncbi:hypothetical protein [Cribrihabitans pelagius]|uniref:hypothetical protein n=1 Tax=Cribrihabitans pelagius TaxID=1765746 RepID=UPI003B5A5325
MPYLIRTTILAAAVATAAAAAPKVAEIDVDADLTSISGYQSASVWGSLEADLETALAKELAGQIAAEGAEEEAAAEIKIEIDSVALADNFERALGVGEWQLKGDVDIDMPDASEDLRYDLTVTADQVNAYFPAGTDVSVVTVDSDIFYHAMIRAFAENVASKLK